MGVIHLFGDFRGEKRVVKLAVHRPPNASLWSHRHDLHDPSVGPGRLGAKKARDMSLLTIGVFFTNKKMNNQMIMRSDRSVVPFLGQLCYSSK